LVELAIEDAISLGYVVFYLAFVVRTSSIDVSAFTMNKPISKGSIEIRAVWKIEMSDSMRFIIPPLALIDNP
jgi:hypothetical protein